MRTHRTIRLEAVPRALAKAEHYRLLNEPRQAESICRDVLEVDPGNERARHMLLLTLTDEFDGRDVSIMEQARALCQQEPAAYERAYYAGVVAERWGKAMLDHGFAKHRVYELLDEALDHYEAAIANAPQGNDDAILRWNTCLRLIERYGLQPAPDPARAQQLAEQVRHFDDEVPLR